MEELKKDELIDSVKTDAPAVEDKTTVEPEKKELPDYRKDLKSGEDKNKDKTDEHVPLKKYLKLKDAYKELKGKYSQKELNNLTTDDLSELANELGVDQKALAKLVKTIRVGSSSEAEEKIKALNAKLDKMEMMGKSNKAFDEDFKKSIVSKYPDLKGKKDLFRKIAFSPDFLHLKTLEDIRKEFFPHAKKAESKDIKKEELEKGSEGGKKGGKEIDFAKMDDETHMEVLKDPKLRKKYYEWADSQGR